MDFFGSERKREILKYLMKGKCRISELREALKMSKSALSQHLSHLRNQGLIAKHGDEIALTNRGIVCGVYLENMTKTLETLSKDLAFWEKHDLSPIPDSFKMRLGDLGDYKIIESHSAPIFNLKKAEFVRVVSAIPFPWLTSLFEVDDISMVLTTKAFQEIAACCDYNTFYGKVRVNDSVRLLCLTSDKQMYLGLFFKNGGYDFEYLLASENSLALTWALDLFQFFAVYGKHVELRV